MNPAILEYNEAQEPSDREICNLLADEINRHLPDAENKIWHAHPVWFLDRNPIVGYSKLKGCVRLFFWSGASFDEAKLTRGSGKFQDASIRYTSTDQVDLDDLERWLRKSRDIQWDYKNLIKKRTLERIK